MRAGLTQLPGSRVWTGNGFAFARQRESDKMRVSAQVARLAANEVERRKVGTVGEALRPRVARVARRMVGRG